MRIAMVLGLALAAVLSPRPASACSPPRGVSSRTVMPDSTTRGVPLNTLIRIAYRGRNPGIDSFSNEVELRPVGGASVAVRTTVRSSQANLDPMFEVRPVADLLPRQEYEVLSRIPNPCETSNCLLATPAVIATFTTSDARDDVPPRFAGLRTAAFAHADSCTGLTCCAEYEGVFYTLAWNTATDDGPAAGIRYQIDDSSGTVALVEGLTVDGFQTRSGNYAGGSADLVRATGPFRVRAVDLAGNVETNDVRVVFPATPIPALGDDDSSGCDVSSGGRTSAAATLLMVGALLALIARRRRAS